MNHRQAAQNRKTDVGTYNRTEPLQRFFGLVGKMHVLNSGYQRNEEGWE